MKKRGMPVPTGIPNARVERVTCMLSYY
uniref:Uncharacterized protein n=1 Tax=Rhizophora mucronata TaxID=61149 RepID=A0A2P2LPW0_RHIMU